MNTSFKDQVAPHLNQAKAEGTTRVQRLRDIGTQSKKEAIAEVSAGFRSLKTIGKEVGRVVKSALVQQAKDTKVKGTSAAQTFVDQRQQRAKTYFETLDAQCTEKYGSTYSGLKQKLQQMKNRYREAMQQQQAQDVSSYQAIETKVLSQVEQAATTMAAKEVRLKQSVKAFFQAVFSK